MALSNKFRLKSNLVTLYGDSNESLSSNDFVPLVMGTNKWTCKQQAGRTKKKAFTTGYLYYRTDSPEMYYSGGKHDKMTYLCDWDADITLKPNWNHPRHYNMFITQEGDIVCAPIHEGGQRGNPIIYPAGDYENPVSVNVPEGVCSWRRNHGIDMAPDGSYFIFSEYVGAGSATKKDGTKACVWKVTKPFTDPANWNIVMEQASPGDILHFHGAQYDPIGDYWITYSGDYGTDSKIWISTDAGGTWDYVIGESEKYRNLQFIFTDDYVYWAPDSGGGTGGGIDSRTLWKCPRDKTGLPIFEEAIALAVLPYGQPIYGSFELLNIPGILFLPRVDLAYQNQIQQIKVLFWSFEDESIHEIAYVSRRDILSNTTFGFRCKALAFQPNPCEDKILISFDYDANGMDINGINQYIHAKTLALEVVRA